jgi:hypothetical protein
MASMHFDHTTLTTLMEMVEDAGLKEAEYLKACNALKYLHESMNHPERVQVGSTERDQVLYRTGELSELDTVRMEIHRNMQQIECLREGMTRARPENVRTVNMHRQCVIVQLMPEVQGRRGRVMKTDEIKQHTQTLIERRLITDVKEMKVRSDQKKDNACRRQVAIFQDALNDYWVRIEALVQRERALTANPP